MNYCIKSYGLRKRRYSKTWDVASIYDIYSKKKKTTWPYDCIQVARYVGCVSKHTTRAEALAKLKLKPFDAITKKLGLSNNP